MGISTPARDSAVSDQEQLDSLCLLAEIVESSDDAIISKNLDGVIKTWNPAAQRIFGYSATEAIGQAITLIMPPELHDEEKDILKRLRCGERIEHYETHRINRDGRCLDVSLTVSPVRTKKGVIVGASKILRDITESKHAQQALATINQQLIDAQEEERQRIARELHDDIIQRLAMLSFHLDALAQSVPTSKKSGQRIKEARKEVANLAEDVRALSHRLHPARLEYLGIAEAAAALCLEMSSQYGVEINFHAEGVPKDLSRRKVVCLYRVLQEALQNAIKHSGATKIEVFFCRTGDQIELTISDRGAGFDLETIQGCGLGLISMKERLKAVHGLLAIRSERSNGTTIRALVPVFHDESKSVGVRLS